MSVINLFKPTEDIRGIDTFEIEGMFFKGLENAPTRQLTLNIPPNDQVALIKKGLV